MSFSCSFDKLVVQYKLNLADNSTANTSHAVGYLKEIIKDNGDTVTVGNQQAKIEGVTANLNGALGNKNNKNNFDDPKIFVPLLVRNNLYIYFSSYGVVFGNPSISAKD